MSERDIKPDDWAEDETTAQRGDPRGGEYVAWCKAVEASARAEGIVQEVLADYEKARCIEAWLNVPVGHLVGEVMRRSGGKANPQSVSEQIRAALKERLESWGVVPASESPVDDPPTEGSDS